MAITGDSQNTLKLAAGMNGKRGIGIAIPFMDFSLEDAFQLAAGSFTLPAPAS